ncbi:MAG: trehalose-phosphatase [Rhodanobacteraceae bacterium]
MLRDAHARSRILGVQDRHRREVPKIRPDRTGALLADPPEPGVDDGWALFLDVDGTLLDFAEHPDRVEVGAALHHDLARMRRRLDGAVTLLSGRPLSQLDDLFGWHGHAAAGLHGAELRTPDGREHFTGDADRFAQTRARAVALAADSRGVVLEDKYRALALHFRQEPGAGATAQHIAESLLRGAGDAYTLQHGDHVIELKPAGMDKGGALAALAALPPFRGRQPWMLGDDLTDEDAFRHINAMDGVSVIVGARRPTAARYALPGPAAVRAWLHALAADTVM